MDDIVARYTLKFTDLASKGILRAAGAARILSSAATVGALGIGALSVAGIQAGKKIVGFANGYAEMIDELDESSRKMNVNASYLKDLRNALSVAGVSTEQVDAGLTRFNKTVGEMKAAGGATKALAKLAPGLDSLLLAASSGTQRTQIALSALGKIEDKSIRAAAAAVLFGKAAGPAIAGALDDVAAIEASFARSRSLTGVITPSAIALAGQYETSMARLKGSLAALSNVIGAAALPSLINLADKFNAYYLANQKTIKSKLHEAFSRISKAMAKVDFVALAEGLLKVVSYLPLFADILGKVIDNAGKLAILFAAIKFTSFLGSVGALVPLLGGLATIFGVVGSAAMALVPLIAGLAVPFLLPLAAIAALIAGGVLLYRNWDMVKAKLKVAFDSMNVASDGFLTKLLNVFTQVKNVVIAPFKAAMALLRGDFTGAVDIMKGAWSGLIDSLIEYGSSVWKIISGQWERGFVDLMAKLIRFHRAVQTLGASELFRPESVTLAKAQAGLKPITGRVALPGDQFQGMPDFKKSGREYGQFFGAANEALMSTNRRAATTSSKAVQPKVFVDVYGQFPGQPAQKMNNVNTRVKTNSNNHPGRR